jgi:hypothetical protein
MQRRFMARCAAFGASQPIEDYLEHGGLGCRGGLAEAAAVQPAGHFDHVLGIPGPFAPATAKRRRDDDIRNSRYPRHRRPNARGPMGRGRRPDSAGAGAADGGDRFEAGELTIDCFPIRHRDADRFAYSFTSRLRSAES